MARFFVILSCARFSNLSLLCRELNICRTIDFIESLSHIEGYIGYIFFVFKKSFAIIIVILFIAERKKRKREQNSGKSRMFLPAEVFALKYCNIKIISIPFIVFTLIYTFIRKEYYEKFTVH